MRSSTFRGAIFSGFSLVAALRVITASNPVHAVFFLVLVFAFTSCLRLLLSREFRALVFVRVYVGAIAVLFLFVVRRLNIQPDGKERPLGNRPRLVVVAALFLGVRYRGLGLDFATSTFDRSQVYGNIEKTLTWVDYTSQRDRVSNRTTVGQVLYTTYCVEFLLAGVVLLVARLAAVLLTLTPSSISTSNSHSLTFVPIRRQQVHQQHSRDAERALFKVS